MTWLEAARQNHREAAAMFRNVAPLFEKIEVAPLSITHACRMHMFTRRAMGSKLFDMGKVMPGDWDQEFGGVANPSLAQDPIITGIRRRYLDGLPWSETGVIEHKLFQIARSPRGKIDGCRTREDLERRYAALDDVAASIQSEGYRVRHDLEANPVPGYDDISISIGRQGELLLATGGLHRLGILQAVGYKKISVLVVTRHQEWQQRRDLNVADDHPDFLSMFDGAPPSRGSGGPSLGN
ncbi:hypothetical protein [Brevundimonas sp. Leaf168]|uniref:hypothetical protein n=1 Tax=Brevundimonas sp. Leaf168 TaxID=1736283 RepID=UPI0006F3703E|nr:hypothetical protein [Brevundimonas sp. Leaf168]KQR56244.1 hypothetical protein ASF81_07220 [Brevundimonas sp. Leaf168]